MRKLGNSVLRNTLLKMVSSSTQVTASACVVDGGAFLHKVAWLPHSNYEDVLEQYVKYATQRYTKYGDVTVVFDGYRDVLSTKSLEQSRRVGSQSSSIQIERSVLSPAQERYFFETIITRNN